MRRRRIERGETERGRMDGGGRAKRNERERERGVRRQEFDRKK